MTEPHFSAVVVTYNSAKHIRPCLDSLRASGTGVVVVDNRSQDDTLEIVRGEYSEACVIVPESNCGYGAAVNLGVAAGSADMILIANADTVFPAGALSSLVEFLRRNPRIGIVGPQQVFPDGAWQRSYGRVGGIRQAAETLFGLDSVLQAACRRWSWVRPKSPKSVEYVDGAVMVVRRRAFEEVGGFDTGFYYYSEDADLCERIRRANWGVYTLPFVSVIHIRGGSSTRIEGRSERLMQLQAKAAYHFVRKYHSAAYLKLYRALGTLHAWKMFAIYKTLEGVTKKPGSNRMRSSAEIFLQWARIWTATRD